MHRLEFYTVGDLEEIVRRSARTLRAESTLPDGGDRAPLTWHAADRQSAAAAGAGYAQVRASGSITAESPTPD